MARTDLVDRQFNGVSAFAGDDPETQVASAATCDIGAQVTRRVAITGTTTITSFGTTANRMRLVRLSGAVRLTYNATSLITPTGGDIVGAAGDTFLAASDASGNWRIYFYQRASAILRAQLHPYAATFPSSNGAFVSQDNGWPILVFDPDTVQTAYFTFVAPYDLRGRLTLQGRAKMLSATSGKCDFEALVEAITPGDATDLDATTSFASANTMTAPTVPGTAGYAFEFSIPLTNDDSIAAGDLVRVALRRDATDATNDNATAACHFLGGGLFEAA